MLLETINLKRLKNLIINKNTVYKTLKCEGVTYI